MVARNTSYLPPTITNFIVFLKQSKETDLPIYNIMISLNLLGKFKIFKKICTEILSYLTNLYIFMYFTYSAIL